MEIKRSKWRSPHDKSDFGSSSKSRALSLALVLSLLAFFGQGVGFFWSGSLALLSDTMHVLTDLFSLAMALLAVRLSQEEPSDIRSFGWYRVEVLASFLNGLLLLFVAIGIAYEAIGRILSPKEVMTTPLLISASFGLLFNLLAAFFLHRAGKDSHAHHGHAHAAHHHHHDHHEHHSHAHEHSHGHSHKDRNLNSALLHVMSDALGSCAVIIGALIIRHTGLTWVDPAVGLLLAVLVTYWSIQVIRDTVHVLLENTPRHISVQTLFRDISQADARILLVEDLHVWEITSRMYALSANIIVGDMPLREADELRRKICHLVEERYGVAHPTFSIQLRGGH